MNTVVIFGGTFNPIHSGHTKILNKLCELDFVCKIILVPTKIPPHKQVSYLADKEHRLEMCRLASKSLSKVEVCDIELLREGKSYTVDTVLEMKKRYQGFRIAITVGADMLVTFDEWKDYMTIINNADIITFFREGVQREYYDSWIEKLAALGANIISIDEPIPGISSTDVRNKLASGEPADGLLDAPVCGYIQEHGLYGDRS